MSEVLYYIPEYHCPEYVPGQSVRLQSLPHEILLKIVAYLDPKSDTRALRYVGKLFKETKINFLGDVAKRMLEEQRTHLLKTQFWRCVCTVEDHFHDFEEFVGKQYVCEQEDIEGDEWAFKKSQLPPANGYYFSSRGFSDDMFYQHDRMNINVGKFRYLAEDEIASRLNGVSDFEVYRNGLLWRRTPGMTGYGGVCQSIHWG